MNEQRADLGVRIAALKDAIVKAGAEVEEIDTSLPEPVKSADVDDDVSANDEEEDGDEDESKLSNEELEAAANRAAAGLGDADGGKPMKTRKVRKATLQKASVKGDAEGELESGVKRAAHIAARKGKGDGTLLTASRFDVSEMGATDYLRAGAGDVEHMVAMDAAHANRAENDVHRADCSGCGSCGSPINELPDVFCNTGSEITNWWTRMPMQDGCTATVQHATGKKPELIVNNWQYGCIPTGESDDNGNPIYISATGLIVFGEDGTPTVPKPYVQADQSTWKVANVLTTENCVNRKYSLQATAIAFDVKRSDRLCKGAYVDRELARGARELQKARAVRGLTALCNYATQSNLTYTGDGSGGLNFGVGLASLIADEFDALAFEHCLDMSQYTAFIMNAPQKWLDMETMRSGGKVSAAGVLQECFGNVISTNCLPAGIERPYTALGGTDGAPHALTPTACEREVTVVLADNSRWIEGVGETYQLVEDRGSRCTALGNGEFHFLEEEYTHIPTDEFASFKMTFKLNNKGQIVEDAPPSCPAAKKAAAPKAEG